MPRSPEARRLVGQHAPALQRHREPLRRRRQHHPAAEVGAEPGLRVAAVMAHPDRQARRHRRPLAERPVAELASGQIQMRKVDGWETPDQLIADETLDRAA